jgi:hypothetical protein
MRNRPGLRVLMQVVHGTAGGACTATPCARNRRRYATCAASLSAGYQGCLSLALSCAFLTCLPPSPPPSWLPTTPSSPGTTTSTPPSPRLCRLWDVQPDLVLRGCVHTMQCISQPWLTAASPCWLRHATMVYHPDRITGVPQDNTNDTNDDTGSGWQAGASDLDRIQICM